MIWVSKTCNLCWTKSVEVCLLPSVFPKSLINIRRLCGRCFVLKWRAASEDIYDIFWSCSFCRELYFRWVPPATARRLGWRIHFKIAFHRFFAASTGTMLVKGRSLCFLFGFLWPTNRSHKTSLASTPCRKLNGPSQERQSIYFQSFLCGWFTQFSDVQVFSMFYARQW